MRHFGDAPENPGPLATDLSTSTRPKAVAKAMRKVADWQFTTSEPYFDRIWTWSALYDGFLAASDSLGDPKYSDAMMAMGKKFDWNCALISTITCMCRCRQSEPGTGVSRSVSAKERPGHAPEYAARARLRTGRAAHLHHPGKEIAWWWCDALFMAPPVWARMYAATGDRKYITYLDEEWAKTSARLYEPRNISTRVTPHI